MLKGISPLLNPDLLKVIAEMGHGDELVIGDGNFPAASMNARCLRCDGHGVPELLDAILRHFPLDTFVEAPVTLMRVVPGSLPDDPPIWATFRDIVERHEPGTKFQFADRFDFYDLSRKAYATVQTGETSLYACIILKKGVISG
ncbi:MAG: RbsD/FucU family protein [Christensenellales bacterium]|jgi:L-fucose mutarotase